MTILNDTKASRSSSGTLLLLLDTAHRLSKASVVSLLLLVQSLQHVQSMFHVARGKHLSHLDVTVIVYVSIE